MCVCVRQTEFASVPKSQEQQEAASVQQTRPSQSHVVIASGKAAAGAWKFFSSSLDQLALSDDEGVETETKVRESGTWHDAESSDAEGSDSTGSDDDADFVDASEDQRVRCCVVCMGAGL